MEDTFNQNFPDEKVSTRTQSLLKPGDYPELDTLELLGGDDVEIYQDLIGAIQWTISIRR